MYTQAVTDGLVQIKPSTRVLLQKGSEEELEGVMRKRTLVLLGVANLPCRFHQVLLVDEVPGWALA